LLLDAHCTNETIGLVDVREHARRAGPRHAEMGQAHALVCCQNEGNVRLVKRRGQQALKTRGQARSSTAVRKRARASGQLRVRKRWANWAT
jgi:hypothetical protein